MRDFQSGKGWHGFTCVAAGAGPASAPTGTPDFPLHRRGVIYQAGRSPDRYITPGL